MRVFNAARRLPCLVIAVWVFTQFADGRGKSQEFGVPTSARAYEVEMTLYEVTKGKQRRVLGRPTIATMEGVEANIVSGGSVDVPGFRPLDFGVFTRVRVVAIDGGHVR